MKFRKIVVGGVEYGWRVRKSAANIEVRGPIGRKVQADTCEVTGLSFEDLYFKHYELLRSKWRVIVPVTPKQIAAWITNHTAELATPIKHPAKYIPPWKKVG